MPFSSKELADYIELINGYLDNISIREAEDFTLASNALKALIDPSVIQTNTKFSDAINSIRELMNEPESFVQDPADFGEFKQIIKNRVSEKITELNTYSELQKQNYIAEINARKLKATLDQNKLSAHTAPEPESEAHVLSDLEWQEYLQNRFQQEYDAIVQAFAPAQLSEAEISRLLQIPLDRRQIILDNSGWAVYFKSALGVTFGDLGHLNSDLLSEFFTKAEEVDKLINKAGVTFDQLIQLDPTIRNDLLNNRDSYLIMDVNKSLYFSFTFDEVLNMESSLRREILENSDTIAKFIVPDHGLTDFKTLFSFDPKIRKELYEHFGAVNALVPYFKDLNEFVQLDPELRSDYMQYAGAVRTFVDDSLITLNELKNLPPERRQELLKNCDVIVLLTSSFEIDVNQLVNLPINELKTILAINELSRKLKDFIMGSPVAFEKNQLLKVANDLEAFTHNLLGKMSESPVEWLNAKISIMNHIFESYDASQGNAVVKQSSKEQFTKFLEEEQIPKNLESIQVIFDNLKVNLKHDK